MAEPDLIAAELRALRLRLPPPLFAEIADGLEETYLAKLQQHPDPAEAAAAAVAEFGDVDTISRAVCRYSPWRRLATMLLATGPALGLVWAVALLARQPWLASLPDLVRVGYGVALLTTIGLLLSGRTETGAYQRGRRRVLLAASALVVLDLAMCVAVLTSSATIGGIAVVALSASLLRVANLGVLSTSHRAHQLRRRGPQGLSGGLDRKPSRPSREGTRTYRAALGAQDQSPRSR